MERFNPPKEELGVVDHPKSLFEASSAVAAGTTNMLPPLDAAVNEFPQ